MTQQLSPAYQLFPYESTVTSTHPSGFPMGVSLKQEKPPCKGGSCYQELVPKVRVELTWGHPHRFLSLVPYVLKRSYRPVVLGIRA